MSQAFNLTAQLNLRGPSNVRTIVADIRRQLGTVTANVNLRVDPNANRSLAQLNRTLQTFNNSLAATQTAATNAASAISNLGQAINSASLQNVPRNIANVGAATQRLAQNANTTAQQVRTARTEMEEFGRQSALAIRRFAAFTTVTSVVFAFTNAIKQGIGAFIEFDKEFVKLQQVTGESANGLQRLASTVTSLASGLGVASSDLIQVSSTLAQAGLNARDTEKALKALALSALAPSFDNLNSTVEGSIALMRQFGISAGDLEKALGSINSVAAQFAVESSDIIAAIQRTGGVFAAASKGVSEGKDALNEFIAVFTSVRATTRESAETIATGLRTIFTRIQRGSTIEALKEFGVTLTDSQGKFVGAYKAIELLSRGLNQIDPRDLKFSQIVEELGGFRQIGKVIPLIQQFATAQQALKVAQEGQGSLAADAVKAQLSLANQISKVREEFLALMRELGGSDTFQTLAQGALSLASGLIKVADSVKGVLPALTALMAIRGASAAFQFGAGFIGGIQRGGGARGLGNRLGGGRNAQGGLIRTYNRGGEVGVPVALMPGEAVLYPEAVKKVGLGKLRKMNYADKKMARGGRVGVVPGSGNSDSFYTTLPEGSFVIRKKATEAIGVGNISDIASGRQKFRYGSKVKAAPRLANTGKTVRSHVAEPKKLTDVLASSISEFYTSVGKKIPKKFTDLFNKSGNVSGELIENLTIGLPKEYNEALKRGSNTIIPLKDFLKALGGPDLLGRSGQISSRQKKQSLPTLSPKDQQQLVRLLKKEALAKSTRLVSDVDYLKKGSRVITSDSQLYGFEKIIKDFYKSKGIDLSRPVELMAKYPGRKRTQERDFLPQALSDNPTVRQAVISRGFGGFIQKFGKGDKVVSRNVGYIDSDEISGLLKDPVKGPLIQAEMKRLGIKGVADYKEYLSNLAASRRQSGDLKKLTNIFGVAGSGKSTMVQGGSRAKDADNARLRKTNRYPILTEADLLRSDQIVDSTSVAGPSQKNALSSADRVVALSSRTKESQEILKKNRKLRDASGKNLFGRKPGATKSAPLDSGIGEAYIAASGVSGVDPKKVTTLKIGENFKKTRTNQPQTRTPDRTGLFYGNFGPTTAGHADAVLQASKKSGIPTKDFVALVGGDSPIDPFSKDPHDRRTALFPQKAQEDKPSRLGMAKSVFGASAIGANVAAMPKGSSPGSIPPAFKVGDDNYIVPKGVADIAVVGDEKDPKSLDKYTKLGYKTMSLPRLGDISGTKAREAIATNNIPALKKLLTPEGLDYVQKHMSTLQKRPKLLDTILDRIQKNSNRGRGVAGQLSLIKSLLSELPSRVTKATPPEVATKIESLRKQRDVLSSKLGRLPSRLVSRLEKRQAFGRGSSKPLQALDRMSRSDLIKEAKKKGISYDWKLLGLRRPLTPDELRKKQEFMDALSSARLADSRQQSNVERIGKKRRLAVVGLIGEKSSQTVVTPGLKNKKGDRITRGVPATLETGALPKDVAAKVQAIIRNKSERIIGAVGKVIAEAAGTMPIKDRKQLRAILSKQLPGVSGLLFESGLAAAGAPYDPKSKAIDFNQGLGKELSGLFGIDPKALVDATHDATKQRAKQKKLDTGQFDRGLRDARNARKAKKTGLKRSIGGEILRLATGGSANSHKKAIVDSKIAKQQLGKVVGNSADGKKSYWRFAPGQKGVVEIVENGRVVFHGEESLGLKVLKNRQSGRRSSSPYELQESPTLGTWEGRFFTGGSVQKFATGGSVEDSVPALLTPGEFVINKKAANTLGASRLHTLNRAHKIQGFNSGGFVQKLGNGGIPQDGSFARLVQQFKQAGDDILTATKKARQAIEQQANATSSSDKMVGQRSSARQDDIQQNRLNRTRARRGLSTSAPVVDAARTKQEYIAQTRSRIGTTSSDPTPSGTSLKAINRAANRAQISLVRTGTNPDGTPQITPRDYSAKTGRTNVDIARLQRRSAGRAPSLESMTPNQVRLGMQSRLLAASKGQGPVGSFRDFSNKASAISNNVQNARNLAAQRAGSGSQTNLSAAGQAYLAQLNATKTPLQRLSAGLQDLGKAFSSPQAALQTLKNAAQSAGAAAQQAGASIKSGFSGLMSKLGMGGGGGGGGLGSGSSSMRARARQLRGQGLRGQDLRDAMGGRPLAGDSGRDTQGREGIGSKLKNAAFGLSFAVPMITDQMTVQNPKDADTAKRNALVGGFGSAFGTASMLASMGPGGMVAAVPAAALGIAKAFSDAENAVIEFNKNMAQDKLLESGEKVAGVLEEINKKGKATPEALDKLSKELANTISAANEVGKSITGTKKSSLVQTELGSSVASFFLGGGKEGSTDRGSARGAINRSMILEQKGTRAYLQAAGDKNTELNMMAEIAPQIAKEAAKSFAVAADAVSAVMQNKFEKGASVTDIFKDPAWKEQANVIARANAEISRQILLIESDTRLTDEEVKARKDSIIAAYAESKVREQFNTAQAQKNMMELAKSTERLSFSFNRMLQNMDATVQASTDSLKQMSANLDLVSASLSGQAKIGNAAGIEQTMNILKNPKGYSATERQGAISTGASLFGGQGSNIQKALTASSNIENTILSVLNQAGSDPSANNESLGIKLENSIRSKLSNIGFPPDLADKIGKQINAKIGDLRKDGEDKIDFTELVEKIPELGKSIDILKGANDGVIQALDGLKNAFDTYSEQSNRLISLQVDINNKLRASQSILTKGSQTLASALGRSVPMNQQLAAADQPIRSMTGGTTDPAQIRANINRLENTRGQLQQGMQGAQNRQDFGAVQAFNTELIRTNTALRDNYDALETLANSGEKASIALDEVNKIQQKQQAGTGLVEGLVTSTPRELASMNSAMARLERNMRGESNGPTTAGQRKESLDLFSRIAPLLGDRQGALKANVLQSQLRESGVQETPFIRGVLDALRNPEADPEMKAATDAYRAAIVEQSKANQELALINSSLAQNIAQQTADAIKNAIEQTRIKFDDKQLADLLGGINNIPQGAPVGPAQGLATGGVVYRASGGEMFVPKGTDTVPAMLTPGEFVVNRQATAKHMPLLKSINNGTSYYAGGGLVKSSFMNNQVNEDINASEVTKKPYPVISSAVYGPGLGTKIVGEPAAVIPTRELEQNISGPIFEQTRGQTTAEESVKTTENKELDLAPRGAELGYSALVRAESRGTAYRPTWVRKLPNFREENTTLANNIPLPPDFITSNSVSLFGPPKPLLKINKGAVTIDNYKESPDSSAISVQESIATELLNNLLAIDIKSDDIASTNQKYPQREWFTSKLERIDLKGYPSVKPTPPIAPTTVPLDGKLMNIQAVHTDGTPTALVNKKSKSPTLTAVKGSHSWSDIGYANDAIYGPIDSALTKEQIDKFNNVKKTYIAELQKYKNDLKEAQTGQFVSSDATRNATASSTLLDQIVEGNFAGLYVTIPSNQLADDWKSKGGSLSIFRRDLLLRDWRTKLDAFKNSTAKIYSVNDNTEATIDSFPFGKRAYPWVVGDPSILDNVVAQFAGEAAQARADFQSEFMMAEMATKEDMANNLPYAFSYRKIRSPKLKEADGFAKPADPRSILDGIIVDPTKEPRPGLFNPFAAATADGSYRFFPGTPEALANVLRGKITEASDAEQQKKIMGPTGIAGLTKLLKVPGIQSTAWISADDKTRAFYATDPADGVPLYDQMVAFRKNLAQQAEEAAAAAGGKANIEAPQPGVNTDAITNNLVPLSRQVMQSVLGPKAGVLSNYGYRLFPIKIFQDISNMAGYLGQVGINFGKQILKPLRQPRPDPTKPPTGKMYQVPADLATVWGSVESAKEIFEGFSKQDYTKISKFISISGGTPSINVPTLLDYAKFKGQQAAAFLNVKDNINQEFNEQTKTDVQAAMNPAAGAIEQAVLDAKTGNISFKKAEAPANLADLGKLALDPYSIIPPTTREALLGQLNTQLVKMNALKLVEQVGILAPWLKFQDAFIASGERTVADYLTKSANAIQPPAQDRAAEALSFLAGNSLGLLPDITKLEQIAANRKQRQQAKDVAKPQTAARGGVIYADKGTLVDYQPRGTDTVPAMLTPGEFVVNRRATQNNLPLLKAINSGQYQKGGKIGYLANGGIIIPQYHADVPNVSARNQTVGVSNLQLEISNDSKTVLQDFNRLFGTNAKAINDFATKLETVAKSLSQLVIPEQIQITAQHKVEVILNGAQALNGVQDGLKQYVVSSINTAISTLNVNTENALGEKSNKILRNA